MPSVTDGRCLGIFPLPLCVLLLCLTTAEAAPRLPDTPVKRPALALELLPKEVPGKGVVGVYALRLGEIFAGPGMAKAAGEVNELLAGGLTHFGVPLSLPVKVQDVEQVAGRVWINFDDEKSWTGAMGLSITAVRMKPGYDWKALIARQYPGTNFTERDGLTTLPIDLPHLKTGVPKTFHCAIIDERTLSLEPCAEIEDVVKAWVKKPRPEWADEWKKYEAGHFALVIHNDPKAHAKRSAEYDPPGGDALDKASADIGLKLLRNMSCTFLGVDVRQGLRVEASLSGATAENAVAVEKALAALRTVLNADLEDLPEPGAALAPGRRESDMMLRDLLAHFTVRRTGKQVALSISSRKIGLETLLKLATEASASEPTSAPPMPAAPIPAPPRPRGPKPKVDIPLPPDAGRGPPLRGRVLGTGIVFDPAPTAE